MYVRDNRNEHWVKSAQEDAMRIMRTTNAYERAINGVLERSAQALRSQIRPKTPEHNSNMAAKAEGAKTVIKSYG